MAFLHDDLGGCVSANGLHAKVDTIVKQFSKLYTTLRDTNRRLSSPTGEVFLQCLLKDVLVRPPLGSSQRAETNVCLAVNLKSQGDRLLSRAAASVASTSMFPRTSTRLFGWHLGLFLVEFAVYPHLRKYVSDSPVPGLTGGLLSRSKNGLGITPRKPPKFNDLAGLVYPSPKRPFLVR